ncbi:MAG: hypothetical protein SNJ78_00480 [Spirochaetales bacterium]
MKERLVLEGLGLTVLTVVFYQFQTTLLIFLIPLVILYKRQGYRKGTYGALLALVSLAIIKVLKEPALLEKGLELLALDLTYPFTFLVGLMLMENPKVSLLPATQRLGIVTLLAAGMGIPLIQYVLKDPHFDSFLRLQVEGIIQRVVEGKSTIDIGNLGSISVKEIVQSSKIVFANTYALAYMLTFLINWVVGYRVGLRSMGIYAADLILGKVKLPEKIVWAFLLGWTGVLTGLIQPLGWVSIVFWNIALLTSALYGIQGVDILRFFLNKMGRFRALALFGIIFSLFIPGLNIIVLVGIPLLGVSELWIQYRRIEEERSAK